MAARYRRLTIHLQHLVFTSELLWLSIPVVDTIVGGLPASAVEARWWAARNRPTAQSQAFAAAGVHYAGFDSEPTDGVIDLQGRVALHAGRHPCPVRKHLHPAMVDRALSATRRRAVVPADSPETGRWHCAWEIVAPLTADGPQCLVFPNVPYLPGLVVITWTDPGGELTRPLVVVTDNLASLGKWDETGDWAWLTCVLFAGATAQMFAATHVMPADLPKGHAADLTSERQRNVIWTEITEALNARQQ